MRVQYKLFFITLLASLVLVLLMLLLAQWGFDRGLLKHANQRQLSQYESLLPSLESIYQRNGSWRALALQPQLWHKLKQQAGLAFTSHNPHINPPVSNDAPWGVRRYSTDRASPPQLSEPRFSEPQMPRLHAPPLALLDKDKNRIIGHEGRPEHRLYLAIMVQGGVAGYLSYTAREQIFDEYDLQLAQELTANLWWIAALMVLVCAALALPFAHSLLKPVQPIVNTLHELANGNLHARAHVSHQDEIAQVAQNVNQLAQSLHDRSEQRKTWLANICHELRTPIAAMRGELETMLDGIRPIQQDDIISAHQKTLQLQRLVEDLYQLTSSDIGALSFHKQDIDALDCLSNIITQIKPSILQAGLTFDFINSLPTAASGFIYADPLRLSQLLHNLIQNSIKYTQTPGKIVVRIFQQNEQLCIDIEDSSPNVTDDELTNIFELLYRGDASSNRQTRGAGLGLAICKSIAQSHQADLLASHSSLGGLKISLRLTKLHKTS